MELSLFLAQLIGLSLLGIGLICLARPKAISDIMRGFEQNHSIVAVSGVISFVAGIAIVLSHNVWTSLFASVVSAVGWALLFKGAVRIAVPGWFVQFVKPMVADNNRRTILVVAAIVVGAYLAYKGFGY